MNINETTEIPQTMNDKRQNKNDFYRFLLLQNHENSAVRANNDILIPRSILKRCDKKGGKKRKEEVSDTEMPAQEDEELQGIKLKRTNPLLSPKFNQIL